MCVALRELGKRDRLPESRPARALPGAAVTAALCAVLRFKTTHCLRLGPSVPVCRGAGGHCPQADRCQGCAGSTLMVPAPGATRGRPQKDKLQTMK